MDNILKIGKYELGSRLIVGSGKYKDFETTKEATLARDNGALGFCLVTADKGVTPKILDFVCNIARTLAKKFQNLGL